MAFGVTPQGFNKKRLVDIKQELENSLKASLGQNINLEPESVLGQLVGIVSEREALVWDMMEDVYNSYYPATSEDTSLDNVASITGSKRGAATNSIAENVLLFGVAGTIITQNSIVSVLGSPTSRFIVDANVTLVAGVDEIQDIDFDNDPDGGSFRININGVVTTLIDFDDTLIEIQSKLDSAFGVGSAVVTGAIDSATGLTLSFAGDNASGLGKRDVVLATFEDNTLELLSVATVITNVETVKGVPQGTVNMTAEDTGDTFIANTGTLSVIETPISGWEASSNPEDAIIGDDLQSNPEFRLTRDSEVSLPGSTTIDAIVSGLEALAGVTAVVAFQNILSIPDLEGRPPHAVDIIVQGSDDDLIAKTIFDDGAAAGIETIGDITKVVKDSQGFDQTIKFSRPDEVAIFVEADLVVNSEFPLDGIAQVEAQILAQGNAYEIGEDIIVFGTNGISCAFLEVVGIVDYSIRIGKTASPTLDDNITIEPREIADFDSARITVDVP